MAASGELFITREGGEFWRYHLSEVLLVSDDVADRTIRMAELMRLDERHPTMESLHESRLAHVRK